MRLLAYELLPGFNPFCTSLLVPPTLGSVVQGIVTAGCNNLRQHLTLEWVPAIRRPRVARPSTAVPADAPAPYSSKGKNNTTKKNSVSASASTQAFCVPLLQTTADEPRINLRRLANQTEPSASSTVKKGTEQTPVCIKSLCAKFGGGCKDTKCKRYHFPKNCSSPPDQVDLSEFVAWLKLDTVKAQIKPTERGAKVFGSL